MLLRRLAVLALFLIIAPELISLPLPSNYEPKRDARLKRLTAGINFVAVPETTNVYEGEDVWVRVYLTCDSLLIPVFTWFDLANSLYLYGGTVELPKRSAGDAKDIGALSQTPILSAEFEFQLNETHYSPNTTSRSDFPHLLPGHYGGYLYFGEQSPDFYFHVLNVPTDLAPIWNEYRRMRILRWESYGRYFNMPWVLDSARAQTERFFALPRDTHYRREGLRSGISLMISYAEHFEPDDSLRIVEYVLALADESRVRDFEVESAVWNALCRKHREKRATYQEQLNELLTILQRFAIEAPTARSRAVFERLVTAQEER